MRNDLPKLAPCHHECWNGISADGKTHCQKCTKKSTLINVRVNVDTRKWMYDQRVSPTELVNDALESIGCPFIQTNHNACIRHLKMWYASSQPHGGYCNGCTKKTKWQIVDGNTECVECGYGVAPYPTAKK